MICSAHRVTCVTARLSLIVKNTRMRILPLAMLLFGSLAAATAQQQDFPLPPPQIASATGKPAPDFRLRDEHAQSITLSGYRGRKVLLMFFRGYW